MDWTTSYSLMNMTESNASLSMEPEITAPYWSLPGRVLFSITMAIIMALAILGNSMVIVVLIKHPKMRTKTNMFLCNLAIADLFTGLSLMPFSLTTASLGEWVFGETFCQLNGFLMPLFLVTSMHTLMYISVHKYISINRAGHVITRRHILMMIFAAWFWGLLTAYLTVHGLNTVEFKPYTTQCGPSYPHDTRTYMHSMFVSVTCYLGPFIVMSVCYARMFREIRRRLIWRRQHSNQLQATLRQRHKVTFTLLLVVIVFLLSWLPYIIYSTYVSVLENKSDAPKYGNPVCWWIGFINSACNPIIYALRNPGFMAGYKGIFRRGTGVTVREQSEVPKKTALGKLRRFVKGSFKRAFSMSSDMRRNSFSIQLRPMMSAACAAPSVPVIAGADKSTRVTIYAGRQMVVQNGKIALEYKRSKSFDTCNASLRPALRPQERVDESDASAGANGQGQGHVSIRFLGDIYVGVDGVLDYAHNVNSNSESDVNNNESRPYSQTSPINVSEKGDNKSTKDDVP